MNYVMSDLHGAYKRYLWMLRTLNINFDKDVLIINGDVLDRNPGSLKLFMDLYKTQEKFGVDHIKILKGNHELFLSKYLKGELKESLYSAFGGEKTISEVKKLSVSERTRLVEIIDSLPLYLKVYSEKRGEDILITHTGPLQHALDSFSESDIIDISDAVKKSVEYDEYKHLINQYIQCEAPAWVRRNIDCTLMVGHVPTYRVVETQGPSIIVEMPGKKVILTDCGAGYPQLGGRLGCIRIEDEAVFYA